MALDTVTSAYPLPRETDEQKAETKNLIRDAPLGAAEAPLAPASSAMELPTSLAGLFAPRNSLNTIDFQGSLYYT